MSTIQPTLNPIIAGFAPDPTLIKHGEWYFLVNSTFHLFPGLPIYASKDLTSWKLIGNAIHRPSQLSLANSSTNIVTNAHANNLMSTGGLYAPTLRFHNGTFYVICTNVIHKADGQESQARTDNFIVTTQDIWSGQWSDPVYFEFEGIDPSLFFDHDGKVYIHGSKRPSPMTTITQFEVDVTTGKKLTEDRIIWHGTGDIYPEGPHIYKRNGLYYLMIAEGGTHEGHAVVMARSSNIWGPYEASPLNPILTARNTDEYIQYTGHCEAFDDDKGQTWGVCLGVRKDEKGRFHMGRETFLTRGTWNDDGWLSFERVKSDIQGLVRPRGVPAISSDPGVDYLYIRDPILGNYKINYESGDITIKATSVKFSNPHASPSFVGKRQRLLDGSTEVILTKRPETGVEAGLVLYKDEHRYARLYYDTTTGKMNFHLVNDGSSSSAHIISTAMNGDISLKMVYTEKQCQFWAKESGGDWELVAEEDLMALTNPDFVGPVIGVFAEGVGEVAFIGLKVE